MKKYLSSGIGVAAALTFVFGSGVAAANNEYKGLTYEKANESITGSGGRVVISSREGSFLPTEKCVVVGSRRANFLDSSGRKSGWTVLLDLNCNDIAAGAHPGNSAASPEGKKVARYRTSAKWLSQDFADAAAAGKQSWCEQHLSGCQNVCNIAGTCSAEVLQFLGG